MIRKLAVALLLLGAICLNTLYLSHTAAFASGQGSQGETGNDQGGKTANDQGQNQH